MIFLLLLFFASFLRGFYKLSVVVATKGNNRLSVSSVHSSLFNGELEK